MRLTLLLRRTAPALAALLLVTALLLALRAVALAAPAAQADTAPPDAPIATAAEATGSLADTLAALEGLTLTLDYRAAQVITLTEGLYEGLQPTLTVALMQSRVVTGDLNSDGAADVALLLATNTGGEEIFFDLAVALWTGERFAGVGVLPLGDRTVVSGMRVEAGQVLVDMLVHAPGDDACCPTLPYYRRYTLRDGILVESPAVDTARLFPYQLNGFYGYVNGLGQWVVRPQFIFADRFSEGMALISFDGSAFGFIDQQGRLAIPAQYAFATPFDGGLSVAAAPAGEEGAPPRVVYIDRRGENVFGSVSFAFGLPFSEGLAAVKFDDGKFGYIDREGNVAVGSQFDYALPFSEGLAPVLMGELVGYTNRSGEMVIPAQYTQGGDFRGGLAPVTVGGGSGYVDRNGELVIPAVFVRAGEFSDGLAAVVTRTITGTQEVYIDPSGRAAIAQPLFTQAGPFVEGLAVVGTQDANGDTLFGYVDTRGNVAIEPQFTAAESFADGLAIVQSRTAWGIIRPDGSWLLQLPLPAPPQAPALSTETPDVVVAAEPPTTTGTPAPDSLLALGAPVPGQATAFVPVTPISSGEVRPGICTGASQVTASPAAWVCTAGGEVFDPCLAAPDGASLICDTDPTDGVPGFTLQPEVPLPARTSPPLPIPGAWVFQLDNGVVCRYVAGTSITVEGQRINYTCSDYSQLLGEINKASTIWTIESVVTSNDGAGNYTVTGRQTVNIARAWTFADQMPAGQ